MTWTIMRWLDRRWYRWHARVTRRNWLDRHPRLWTIGTVPLSTWLTRPAAGRESYQAHLGPLLLEQETRRLHQEGTR